MALAIGFALLAAFGFGSGAIFIRLATQRLPATTATFVTVVVGFQSALVEAPWTKPPALVPEEWIK